MVCSRAPAQFFLNGSAVQTNDSCFQLTTEVPSDAGSIWFAEKIDLRQSFDLVMELNLGCADALGADGLVFALQPVSTSIGATGEGLGIDGVRPALAVEFDTWQNFNRNDPPEDHIAIMANGAVTHDSTGNLAGPVQADADDPNIERCAFIPMRVSWEAPAKRLSVYFDCELRLEYSGDVVRDIFGGDPRVFYGFAAATGGRVNEQQVCFRFNSLERRLADVTVCPGGAALLDVGGGGGRRYEWSPAAGLDRTDAASVVARPAVTTDYLVKIFDDCGLPVLDTVRVSVDGRTAPVELGPDTAFCPGGALRVDVTTETATYAWSDPALSGPVVDITRPGTYDVTVTRTDSGCESQDRVTVSHFPTADLDLGPRDTTLCRGDSLLLRAGTFPGTAVLDDGRRFAELWVDRPGTYRATAEDACGGAFDQLVLRYEDCNVVYLPTAFSPNGDGTNDRFFPQDGGDVLAIHDFAVYNRWGGLVYRATDGRSNEAAFGWDGRGPDGRPAPPAVYVWTLEASFRAGSRETRHGQVTLVR